MPQIRAMPEIAGLNMMENRSIDDHSINVRLRDLQEKKDSIAQMARKYDLEDNTSVERLSLLTIHNKRGGGRAHDSVIGRAASLC